MSFCGHCRRDTVRDVTQHCSRVVPQRRLQRQTITAAYGLRNTCTSLNMFVMNNMIGDDLSFFRGQYGNECLSLPLLCLSGGRKTSAHSHTRGNACYGNKVALVLYKRYITPATTSKGHPKHVACHPRSEQSTPLASLRQVSPGYFGD